MVANFFVEFQSTADHLLPRGGTILQMPKGSASLLIEAPGAQRVANCALRSGLRTGASGMGLPQRGKASSLPSSADGVSQGRHSRAPLRCGENAVIFLW